MSESRSVIKVQLGDRFYLAFTPSKIWATATSILALSVSAVALWQANEEWAWLTPIANALLAISGAVFGICISPTPKPTDYSHVAILAVDDLAELNRASSALQDDLQEAAKAVGGDDPGRAALRLAVIEEELKRQERMTIRQIAFWAQVAPGSDDEIVKGRRSAAATLAKLEKELG